LQNSRPVRTLVSLAGLFGMLVIIWQMYWFDKEIEKVTKTQNMLQFGLSRPFFAVGLFMFCLPTLIRKGSVLRFIFDNAF